MSAKKQPTVNTKVTGTCEMFATFPMVCPLCGITVPADTVHRCEKKEPTR